MSEFTTAPRVFKLLLNLDAVKVLAMQIRRFQSTDLHDVLTLHNLALHATGAHLGSGPWDADLEQIEAVYVRAGGEFLIGELDGKCVAMGGLRRSGATRAEIKRMRVHPQYQRRGLGRSILRELETRAASLGYRTVHLDTTDLQPAAMKLYSEHGYRKVREEARPEFTVLYFEKTLRPAASSFR